MMKIFFYRIFNNFSKKMYDKWFLDINSHFFVEDFKRLFKKNVLEEIISSYLLSPFKTLDLTQKMTLLFNFS